MSAKMAESTSPEQPNTRVYISIGSNLGDRASNLRAAIRSLTGARFHVLKVSSFYETEPVGYLDQPWFLNCVVEGETNRQPGELLDSFRALQMIFRSKKEFTNGPRILDIDILLYGNLSVDTSDLQIPHPRMLLRKFVLVPLAEIAPQLRHPSWDATASELLARSTDPSTVRPAST
jgi:2-amino-4-hydroxy-6-hydroxymethyldihydropteridine diphosphokinase